MRKKKKKKQRPITLKKKKRGGHWGKTASGQFYLIAFPPNLGGKIFVDPGRKFSP